MFYSLTRGLGETLLTDSGHLCQGRPVPGLAGRQPENCTLSSVSVASMCLRVNNAFPKYRSTDESRRNMFRGVLSFPSPTAASTVQAFLLAKNTPSAPETAASPLPLVHMHHQIEYVGYMMVAF